MRIISDKTGKEYSSVEECLKAEELYDKQQKEKKERAEKLAKDKEVRRQEVIDAFTNYYKLYQRYIKDYGEFSIKIKNDTPDPCQNKTMFSELIKNFLL